jgi:hypothetical protein
MKQKTIKIPAKKQALSPITRLVLILLISNPLGSCPELQGLVFFQVRLQRGILL